MRYLDKPPYYKYNLTMNKIKGKRILSIVLAGGEGKRLMPLTKQRAKPAVPFGGTYRLIDFPLSNLVNSDLRHIIVLTQYKSHSLDRHISKTWRMSPLLGNFVSTVPAQQRVGKSWYLGSADAIYQCLNIIEDEKPDIVVILGADNVYRMDFSKMIEAHIESGAEFTVAGIRQPIETASEFGVIDTDPERSGYIKSFLEKPQSVKGLPDSPNEILASMGNYVANVPALIVALTQDHKLQSPEQTKHDMGGDIVPYFVNKKQCGFYDFTFNDVPGSTDKDRNYWQDVGTLDAYYHSNMDLIAADPIFNLYNDKWPIFTGYMGLPPAKFVHADLDANRIGTATSSIISPGVIVSGSKIDHSLLSPGVRVNSYATVKDSIILDNVEIGRHCQIKNAIIDKDAIIHEGVTIGYDLEADRKKGFTVTESNLVVVPKSSHVYKDYADIGHGSHFH